ncbi:hypothetical protein F5B22DRAFT_648929 [Xylaria bambusicola]|uniref:uncharacterized protein n=1 Tax=Xylaria bambusicola TaxID=326684 RepID=UPI002007EA0D|nr:uncharacterized protein F5B22DRAFT_648929 [Xylaria bambusicola]KAI0509504.1 hypothetical protein F5B22DRAFT_648929 [Xylaria bambusicola]
MSNSTSRPKDTSKPLFGPVEPISNNDTKETEDDMFVLISKRNYWKDGKLVSSSGDPEPKKEKPGIIDKDGFETIALDDPKTKKRHEYMNMEYDNRYTPQGVPLAYTT